MPGLQDLSSIFNEGQYGLLNRGLQAQTTDQNTNDAALAEKLQKTSQDAQAFPLEQLVKQGQLDHDKALTRSGNAGAAAQEFINSTQLPKEEVIAEGLRKMHSAQSEDQRKQFASQMAQRMQLAAIAKANKGTLPTEIMLQLPIEERAYFKDAQSTALMDTVANAYHKASPTWQEKRAEEDNRLKIANVQGQWRYNTALDRPQSPGRGGTKPDVDPNNRQSMANYIAGKKTIGEKLEALKVYEDSFTPAEKAYWIPVYEDLSLKARIDMENKKRGGGIDYTKVGKTGIPIVPIQQAPGMEHKTSAPPPNAYKIAYDKSGKPVYKVQPGHEQEAEAQGYTVK